MLSEIQTERISTYPEAIEFMGYGALVTALGSNVLGSCRSCSLTPRGHCLSIYLTSHPQKQLAKLWYRMDFFLKDFISMTDIQKKKNQQYLHLLYFIYFFKTDTQIVHIYSIS